MQIVPSELWTSLRSPFKSGPEEESRGDFRHWSSFFRLHRKCGCAVCNEDKKVQEFSPRNDIGGLREPFENLRKKSLQDDLSMTKS